MTICADQLVRLGGSPPGSRANVVPRPKTSASQKYRMPGFRDTVLDSILRNLGVITLLFAGVNMDQCVLCTLQEANFHGYDCILLEDCAATTSPSFCAEAAVYNARLRDLVIDNSDSAADCPKGNTDDEKKCF